MSSKKDDDEWGQYVTYGLIAVGAIGITAGAYYYFNYYDGDSDKEEKEDKKVKEKEEKDELDMIKDPPQYPKVKTKSEQKRVRMMTKKNLFADEDKEDEKKSQPGDHLVDLDHHDQLKPPTDEKLVAVREEDYDVKLKRYHDRITEISSILPLKYKDGVLTIKSIQLTNLDQFGKITQMDVYVSLSITDQEPKHKENTTRIAKNRNPLWDKEIKLKVKDPIRSSLKIKVQNQTTIFGTTEPWGGTVVPLPLAFKGARQKIECFLTEPRGQAKAILYMAYEEPNK